MANWDYMVVSHSTNNASGMELHLKALGSLGWEVCGMAAADPTIGFNALLAILRREVAAYGPPTQTAAGWRVDPAGRFEQRYWDGLRWTEHVLRGGVQETDYPNVR